MMNRELCQRFVAMRRNHPAWLLLASRNGPLTLSCLQTLVENHPGGVALEDAVEQLTGLFAAYANDSEFETGNEEDHHGVARKEIRKWVKRGLVVEREGQVMATDALQRSLAFLEGLEERAMTSTASRLATVQREIGELEGRLSPSQTNRAELLKEKIALLEKELEAVERGEFEVLEGPRAREGIREVYQLAISLRADFRRVEDSYREADLTLRQRIISENHHRGEIIDELLSGHESLVDTPEGQVFEGFYQQLKQSAELDRMKTRLRSILENSNSDQALDRKQKRDLRQLVSQLVGETARVIQARARSERDVRGFLTSGLADEQLRVGAVLQDVLRVALEVDWQAQDVRRSPGPLPPVAVAIPNAPLPERLMAKETTDGEEEDLDLTAKAADLSQMDEEFWQAYDSLDRAALFESTITHLKESGQPITLAALAKALPASHDLESLTYWLAMAREAGIQIEEHEEHIDLFDEDEGWTRFRVPQIEFAYSTVAELKLEDIE